MNSIIKLNQLIKVILYFMQIVKIFKLDQIV